MREHATFFLLLAGLLLMLVCCEIAVNEAPETKVGIICQGMHHSAIDGYIDEISHLKSTGVKTVGLVMSPNYHGAAGVINKEINCLVDLAKAPQIEQFFLASFDTYVIDCYAFSSGIQFGDRLEDVKYQEGGAYREIKDLAIYLSKTYGYTDKQFILKNRNSDSLFNYKNDHEFGKYQKILLSWFLERIRAVEDARAEGAENVYSAIEFDVALSASQLKCVLTEIIPNLSPDLFSYSSFRLKDEMNNLPMKLEWIRYYAKPSRTFGRNNVMIGGATIRSDNPVKLAQEFKWFLKKADQLEIPFVMYLSLYRFRSNNYPVFDTDGEPTLVWVAIREFLEKQNTDKDRQRSPRSASE